MDIETTSRGAALAAGLAVGLWNIDQFHLHPQSQIQKKFESKMSSTNRDKLLLQWHKAVYLSFGEIYPPKQLENKVKSTSSYLWAIFAVTLASLLILKNLKK